MYHGSQPHQHGANRSANHGSLRFRAVATPSTAPFRSQRPHVSPLPGRESTRTCVRARLARGLLPGAPVRHCCLHRCHCLVWWRVVARSWGCIRSWMPHAAWHAGWSGTSAGLRLLPHIQLRQPQQALARTAPAGPWQPATLTPKRTASSCRQPLRGAELVITLSCACDRHPII